MPHNGSAGRYTFVRLAQPFLHRPAPREPPRGPEVLEGLGHRGTLNQMRSYGFAFLGHNTARRALYLRTAAPTGRAAPLERADVPSRTGALGSVTARQGRPSVAVGAGAMPPPRLVAATPMLVLAQVPVPVLAWVDCALGCSQLAAVLEGTTAVRGSA